MKKNLFFDLLTIADYSCLPAGTQQCIKIYAMQHKPQPKPRNSYTLHDVKQNLENLKRKLGGQFSLSTYRKYLSGENIFR